MARTNWAIEALYRRLSEERTRRPLTVAYCWLMLGGIGRANARWLWEIEILVREGNSQSVETLVRPVSLIVGGFVSSAKPEAEPPLTLWRG